MLESWSQIICSLVVCHSPRAPFSCCWVPGGFPVHSCSKHCYAFLNKVFGDCSACLCWVNDSGWNCRVPWTCTLSFQRLCQSFPNACTILRSYEPCSRVLAAPQPHQLAASCLIIRASTLGAPGFVIYVNVVLQGSHFVLLSAPHTGPATFLIAGSNSSRVLNTLYTSL